MLHSTLFILLYNSFNTTFYFLISVCLFPQTLGYPPPDHTVTHFVPKNNNRIVVHRKRNSSFIIVSAFALVGIIRVMRSIIYLENLF